MRSLLTRLSYQFFPGTCILCGDRSRRRLDLCLACESDLTAPTRRCEVCALPIASGHRCGPCLISNPPYCRSLVAFDYRFPVDRLINAFKQGNETVGHVLANVLARHYEEQMPRTHYPDFLVPVPLTRARLTERGFNQALVIAQVAGSLLGLPVDGSTCIRKRDGPAQKTLSAHRRRQNLKGVFAITREVNATSIGIVDDVVTTGTTVKEISARLIAKGASSVQVIALARTPHPSHFPHTPHTPRRAGLW